MRLELANAVLYAQAQRGWEPLGQLKNVRLTTLDAAMDFYAGGPGSGCNPAVGKCGRPAGQWRKFNANRVGGYFQKGTVIARMYEEMSIKVGQWFSVEDFVDKFKSENVVVEARLRELAYTGKRSGLWTVERKGDAVRMWLQQENKSPVAQKGTSQEEQKLLSAKIVNKELLRGGGGENYLVRLADGSKAVWKPDSGERSLRENITVGYQGAREAGTYKVAQLVGLTDLVPPTVRRTIDGQEGSLQQFMPGKVAAAVPEAQKYDGETDLARAAVFDYVIGNEDRHDGNWLVNGNRLVLIDHGVNFPDKGGGYYRMTFNRYLIDAAEKGKAAGSPRDYAAPYQQNKQAIVAALKEVGLPQGAVTGVARRIDSLSRQNWSLKEGRGKDA